MFVPAVVPLFFAVTAWLWPPEDISFRIKVWELLTASLPEAVVAETLPLPKCIGDASAQIG